jgi:alcohol dehydrogenase
MFPSFFAGTRVFADVSGPQTLAQEVMRLGSRKALVVTDAGVLKAGVLDLLKPGFPEACSVRIFSDVMQDPTVDVMDAIGRICREDRIDMLVGIGGGACLDAAKGAAIVAVTGASVREAVGEDKVSAKGLPVIAVPTTAGTGSEVSWHISVNDTERHLKVTVRSPRVVPTTAILDAALIASVPRPVIAAAGLDALTHSLESYVSNVGNWDLTDAIALHACEMIGRALVPYWNNPGDREHASQMLLASCFGGLVLSHSRTGIVHQMARPLGAQFHVPHGLANAVLLPWCLEFSCSSKPERFMKIARALGEDVNGIEPAHAAKRVVNAVRRINSTIQIPSSLAVFGVTEDALERLAVDALQGKPSVTNPCRASKEEVMQIYRRALRGSEEVAK